MSHFQSITQEIIHECEDVLTQRGILLLETSLVFFFFFLIGYILRTVIEHYLRRNRI